jgi:hypothetical protein
MSLRRYWHFSFTGLINLAERIERAVSMTVQGMRFRACPQVETELVLEFVEDAGRCRYLVA